MPAFGDDPKTIRVARQSTSPFLRTSIPYVPPAGGAPPAVGFTPNANLTLSGTLTAGETLTIIDAISRFGMKPNGQKAVAVHLWDEEAVERAPNATLSRVTSDPGGQFHGGGHQTTVAPPNGSGAYEYQFRGLNSGAVIGGIPLSDPTKTLFAATIRTNFDGLDAYAAGGAIWNLKGWRYWSNGVAGGQTGNLFPAWGQQNRADGLDRYTAEYVGGDLGSGYPLEEFKNQWRRVHWRLNRPQNDLAHTQLIYGIDTTTSTKNWDSNNTFGQPAEPFDFLFDWQEQNAWADTSFRYWIGFRYIDDSWCRAVLRDASGNEEILPIVAWAPGEVQVYLRLGMFASVSGLTLRVYDNDDTAIDVGTFS